MVLEFMTIVWVTLIKHEIIFSGELKCVVISFEILNVMETANKNPASARLGKHPRKGKETYPN